MKFDKYYEARNIIENLLVKDLFGPVEDNEIINDAPLSYYSVGILYPQKAEPDQEEVGENELEDVQEPYDATISLSNTYNPSTMAITTTLKAGVKKIKIKVSVAQYELVEQNSELEFEDKRKDRLWRRVSYKFENSIDIPVIDHMTALELKKGLELQLYSQRIFKDDSKMITVALVNKNISNKSSILNNQNSFFQTYLELSDESELLPIFIDKKMRLELNEDNEVLNLNMLYSHIKNYAAGHGCSVEWEENEKGAFKIKSSFMPGYELKQMKPAVKVKNDILRMDFLADASKEEVINALNDICHSYEMWIKEQEKEKNKFIDKIQNLAEENIKKCFETKNRLEECINLFKKNNNAFRAFQLANLAMLEQRKQFYKKNNKQIELDKITWYPFQIAFILQEIPSIVNTENNYRNIVDLLWFPTGGGKTEAYLGLSAFTIFFRRLRPGNYNGGVTIIMRYTLRLLTLQQFERAAALICACENIRKIKKISNEEISIGLWVGGGLTPNSLKVAQDNLIKIKNGENVVEANPCQLLLCPWCGQPLSSENYSIDNNKLSIKCPNENCEFNKGLPIYLVDEDIYRYKPTLIVSTVDKFARMTWEPQVGEIFGLNTKYDPPELIIQDELHLISGPLGTITGLYEVAVSKFCEKNNIKAKVIASTATIRNAKSQIRSLYGRDFRQFPPQGINIRDSYFAIESSPDDKPSRKYLGILSPDKSGTTILVRVYACLLFATRYLIDIKKDHGYDDNLVDNFWTIIGYFNSLRELGGAVIQLLDDVQDRYKYLYSTKFKNIKPEFTNKHRYDWYTELTSRKPNSEIAEIIQKKLKIKYPDSDAYDFVLASNMLSVGVDVSRLGIMAITGQPKTNAEYIQASSRVGRENPGLVLVIYNRSHSRDRSHYEQFVYYHSAIYKFVEATSITPFSDRSRERALPAVFISLCRQLISELKDNDAAKKFDMSNNEIKVIEKYIIEYVKEADPAEYENTIKNLREIEERWDRQDKNNLVYQKNNNLTHSLLKNDSEDYGEFETLNSMRNVDVQSNIYLEED